MTNTGPATAETYFSQRGDCHAFCRIARGLVGTGERHDPRCAAVTGMGPGEREKIAGAAEARRRSIRP